MKKVTYNGARKTIKEMMLPTNITKLTHPSISTSSSSEQINGNKFLFYQQEFEIDIPQMLLLSHELLLINFAC